VKLGIVYHMPFWQAADGSWWELEGSFARYVDSLAPYFDEISLCVPVYATAQPAGTRLRAANVTVAPLPFFDGPKHFYPKLPSMLARIARWVRHIDLLHCRVPTPAAYPAFVVARLLGTPVFLLVVGDLNALLPTMPYRGLKKRAWAAYTAFEEWALARMTRRSLTFANGADLTRKHDSSDSPVVDTKTTTISASDIANRADTCTGGAIRLLAVSRIDPRKGLRCLPGAVAILRASGVDARLDIVGPTVGAPGEAERDAIVDDARRRGVAGDVQCVGAVPLQQLLRRYAEYDLFVLPTLPGEGIPRVLLEAMASGLPVASVPAPGPVDIVQEGVNGAIADNLLDACWRAVRCSRTDARASIANRTLNAGHEVFRAHLVPVQPQTPYLIPPRTGVGIFGRRPAALPRPAHVVPQHAAG